MAYVTLSEVRAEGVPDSILDARVNLAIADVSRRAEDICKAWFESRDKTYTMSGNGRDRITLEQPCIELTSVTLDDVVLTLATDAYLRPQPRNMLDTSDVLARKASAIFSEDVDNLVVVGKFGTVDKSSGTAATPADLKAALLRWVVLRLPLATDEDAHVERAGLTATSRTVEGRSLSLPSRPAPWSGDPEVDRILRKYCRRSRAGVV